MTMRGADFEMIYWFEEPGYVINNKTLVESYPALGIIYLIGMSFTFTVGTVGNISVIGAIFVNQYLRNSGNVLLINLAVADLNICSCVSIMCVMGVTLGEPWFVQHPILCDFFASYVLIAYYSSLLNIGAVSFNRYIHICHYDRYRRIFTKRNTIILAIVLWGLCVAIDIPEYFGWGGHNYDVKLHFCSFAYRRQFSYTLTAAFFGVMCPCALILLCYLRIFRHVRLSKKRVSVEGNASSRSRQESMKLAGTFFVLFIGFTVCWLPFLLATLIQFVHDIPDICFVVFIFLAHCNSTANVFLYGLTNSHFRAGYVRFLRLDRYFKSLAPAKTTYVASIA